MVDFSKTIENSQRLPELPDDMEADVPSFLKQDPVTIARRARGEEGTFPGATKYPATYHCERLMIGQVVEAYERGNPVFKDIDESDRLKEIMDLSLQGRALVMKKVENILKDGTVVVWVEWAEHKPERDKKDRNFLTETELRTPSTAGTDFDDDDEDDDDDAGL